MKLTFDRLWGHTERPWGYEIRVIFKDEEGRDVNDVLTFEKKPTEEEIQKMLDLVKAKWEGMGPPPNPTKIFEPPKFEGPK